MSAMKEAASSIGTLLQSVDQLLAEGEEKELPLPEARTEPDGRLWGQRSLLDGLWVALHAGEYDHVAEQLCQSREGGRQPASPELAEEYKQCQAVLLKLCERTMRRATRSPVACVAKAIRAIGLVQRREFRDVMCAHFAMDPKRSQDPEYIVRASKLVHAVGLALGMGEEQGLAIIRSLFAPDGPAIPTRVMLLVALRLCSYDHDVGGVFFDRWLQRSREELSKIGLPDLFQLSQLISERCKMALPRQWTDQLRAIIKTPIPADSAMLFAPLLDTEEQARLLPLNRKSEPTSPGQVSSEKLLVPLGLPRLVRLSP